MNKLGIILVIVIIVTLIALSFILTTIYFGYWNSLLGLMNSVQGTHCCRSEKHLPDMLHLPLSIDMCSQDNNSISPIHLPLIDYWYADNWPEAIVYHYETSNESHTLYHPFAEQEDSTLNFLESHSAVHFDVSH